MAQHDTAHEEQRLAELVARGDQEAFRVLFERHGPRIYRFCYLMIGEKAGAEDVYQETFVALWQACHDGKTLHSVQGYLIAVARTRCLNYLRIAHRDIHLEDVAEPYYEPDITAVDRNEHVQQALLKLPDQYREAIVLCEYEGYSYEEMAEALDCSHHVVKNRIHRAKRMLREFLGPILRDDNDALL